VHALHCKVADIDPTSIICSLKPTETLEIGIAQYMSCVKVLERRLRVQELSRNGRVSIDELETELSLKSDLINHYSDAIRTWEVNFAALSLQTQQVLDKIIPLDM
jgi:hypothetical protein